MSDPDDSGQQSGWRKHHCVMVLSLGHMSHVHCSMLWTLISRSTQFAA